MQHSRFILALSCISLSAVVFSGAAKVHQVIEFQYTYAQSPQSISWGSPRLTIDPTFFHEEMTVSGSKKPNNETVKLPTKEITAYSYVAGNINTGKIYLELNPNVKVPIASMSKLLTAIVATDTLAPTSIVPITENEASAPPDQSGIGSGEKYEAQELLYPLLLDSSNIAAEALADSKNRRQFLEDMTSYALEIGMPDTSFADPSGVDPRNSSSAKDFFSLSRYLSVYRPDILALTRTVRTSVASTSNHGAHEFRSIHPFVTDPRFIGGKTGRTPEARETMLTMMKINGQNIAIVILGSEIDHRASDTTMLINSLQKVVK